MRKRHLLLALVLVVAGCGGGGKTYDADKSRACLVKAHFAVTDPNPSDLVASAAEGGSFSVHIPGNLVTVSFGLDRKGTERIVRAYQHFQGKNIGLTDVLKVKENAVILWSVHPKDSDIATIEGCLK